MTIRLYDTMQRKKVDFVPADPKRVTMYVCGPTVYGRAHIGNARPAVVFDVLQRLLRHEYGAENVVYARNITDIDDKIMAAAATEGVAPKVITDRYEAHYLADMGALGVQPPDLAPHATDYVEQMKAMIADLIAKGAAYAVPGHEVLFDISALDKYPVLSKQQRDQMRAGSRAEILPYKRNEFDFVLWKPSVDGQIGWDSPWGFGRPGWHIECSAMIAAELGETIDIHGGGLDLIFPHHENEIAQSVCAHGGAPLARVWMHNGFLSMGDTKMSKSLGNVVGVDELLAQGWSGEVLRLALLSAHYRQPLAWTEDLLYQSKATLRRWYSAAILTPAALPSDIPDAFRAALADDLNTPLAIATLSEAARTGDKAGLIAACQSIGLLIGDPVKWLQGEFAERGITVRASWRDPDEQIAARTAARARKDFAESDRIRDDLAAQGIILEDNPGGTTWRRA
jgi:cysteinyl-tRNA synthetase